MVNSAQINISAGHPGSLKLNSWHQSGHTSSTGLRWKNLIEVGELPMQLLGALELSSRARVSPNLVPVTFKLGAVV